MQTDAGAETVPGGSPGGVLRGERVTLRPFTAADLPAMTAIVTDPEIARWWVGYDVGKVRCEFLGDPRVSTLAIELDGEFIGGMMYTEELDPDYRSASIDLTLDAAHLGQGLGSDALRTLARHLFEQHGHHRITIDPAVDNERAIRAYTKVGFRPVGILRRYERVSDGVWRDALLMELLDEDLR